MTSVRLPSAEQPSWTRVRHTLNPVCVTAARANPSGLSSCFSTTDSARAGALAWPVLNPPALIGSERTAELKPHLTRLGDRLANVFGSDRSFECFWGNWLRIQSAYKDDRYKVCLWVIESTKGPGLSRGLMWSLSSRHSERLCADITPPAHKLLLFRAESREVEH
ncbi:hypothetical protein AOLI_G00330600 [Acnodon oligacanthus]